MNIHDIYSNAVLPESRYFAKLMAVETNEVPLHDRPCILGRFKIAPLYTKDINCTEVVSVIHPTLAAKDIWLAFREMFLISGDDYEGAVGKFGHILIKPREYKGKEYGSVIYPHQRPRIVKKSRELQSMDEKGYLIWSKD